MLGQDGTLKATYVTLRIENAAEAAWLIEDIGTWDDTELTTQPDGD